MPVVWINLPRRLESIFVLLKLLELFEIGTKVVSIPCPARQRFKQPLTFYGHSALATTLIAYPISQLAVFRTFISQRD